MTAANNAWLKLYYSLPRHPKTNRLARCLGITRDAAVGIAAKLFLTAGFYAPKDGDLGRVTDERPEGLCDYLDTDHEPQALVEALRKAGFLDEWKVHNWDFRNTGLCESEANSRAGRASGEARRKKAEKKAAKKANKRRSKQRSKTPSEGAERRSNVVRNAATNDRREEREKETLSSREERESEREMATPSGVAPSELEGEKKQAYLEAKAKAIAAAYPNRKASG